jgi:hypothetical protein
MSPGGHRSRPAALLLAAVIAASAAIAAAWWSDVETPANAARQKPAGRAAAPGATLQGERLRVAAGGARVVRDASAAGATLQGERLRVAAGSGRVVRDASAAGRRALVLTGGAVARGRVRLRAASRLSVIARGSGCAGAPRIAVSIGGVRVVSGTVRGVRRWSTLRATAILRAGTRAVGVRLLNPRRTARCRRGARIDRLAFTPAPAPVAGRPAWSPAVGVTWQWQLSGAIDLSVDAELYDVDLFDTPAATVAELHARGRHVVCYLDAGTYEPGRPDSQDFPDAVLGAGVEGWPGERWLDVRRLDVLGPILERRMDLCRDKGFDGVEPDNVDAYANASGFPLSAADQLAFNRFLAAAAHARGLSAGLKNDLDQVAALEPDFDWALDEQCYQYRECDALRPFARAGKAVLIAEYETAPAAFCAQARAAGYSAIRKRLDLDAWRQPC